MQEAATDLDVNTNPPSRQEIISAITVLKNGKAPGLDNLNAELFKADPNLTADILLPLFTQIWEQEKVPLDWTKGVIIKIRKLSDCNNWRGITLLSIPRKIVCKIIIQRITSAVDQTLRNEQTGLERAKDAPTRYLFLATLSNNAQNMTAQSRHQLSTSPG